MLGEGRIIYRMTYDPFVPGRFTVNERSMQAFDAARKCKRGRRIILRHSDERVADGNNVIVRSADTGTRRDLYPERNYGYVTIYNPAA
jgi:hypothetical protein